MDHKESLKDYHIICKLGSGAFGEVYEAINTSFPTQPRVAIKIIPKVNLNTNTRRRRIAREVTLHASFPSHPSILKLHSYFEDAKSVYIVTELCTNGNLYRYVSGHPEGLPEDQVRGIMRDIVEGVQQLHSRGIMHRDLKLSNILLDKNLRTKIADFGLARIIDDSKSEEEFTFCGTPNYISPEILNRQPYGLGSDVWSLGCIFLTLLTGTPPFSGVEIEDVLSRVIKGAYNMPRRISRDTKNLARSMLEKDAAERISTFDILKNRFFDGPIRELSPLRQRLTYIEEADVGEEIYHDDYLLPPKPSVSRRRSVSRDKLDTRPSVDVQHPSRRSSVRDRVGLRTVLEEIGVSDEYQGRRRSREIPAKDIRVTRRPRNSQEDEDQSRSVFDTSLKDYRLSRHESPAINKGARRISRQYEDSTDSYSRQKEAEFDIYEDDELRGKHHDPRHTNQVDTKSPGEGLRNALGNLGKYLNINAIKKRQPSALLNNGIHQSQQPLGRTRARTSSDAQCSHESRRKDQENLDTEPKERSSDVQRGLLSLLSNFNETHNGNGYKVRKGLSQGQSQFQSHESRSFTPLLPHQNQPTNKLSSKESTSFATKYIFSTSGIPPLTQRTKHGVVEITHKGDIALHLPSTSPNSFTISADSKYISVRGEKGFVWRGDADDLPWRWTKVYRYASRFVTICRAKIPQITLEMNGIKGRLMLNGEFEAYNAGDKMVWRIIPEEKSVKVFKIERGVEKLQWQGPLDDVPKNWRDISRSSTTLYKKCLALSTSTVHEGVDDNTAMCIPGVGWCSVEGTRIQLLFEDGIRMEIQLQTKEVLYCGGRRRKEKWRLDDQKLPEYIWERLIQSQVFKM